MFIFSSSVEANDMLDAEDIEDGEIAADQIDSALRGLIELESMSFILTIDLITY